MKVSPQNTPEPSSHSPSPGQPSTLSPKSGAQAWEGGEGAREYATGGREPTEREDRRREARRCQICAHNLFLKRPGVLSTAPAALVCRLAEAGSYKALHCPLSPPRSRGGGVSAVAEGGEGRVRPSLC